MRVFTSYGQPFETMNNLRFYILTFLTLVSSLLSNAQILQKAELKEGDFFYAKLFEFKSDSTKITVNDKGEIKGFKVDLKLNYEDGFHTRVIHYLDFENSLLICAEITNDDVSYNELVCIDKLALKQKWNTQIRNFNLTVGLIENNDLYIGTINSVYKLNFQNGKKIWTTDGFYTKYKINNFISIGIQGDSIELFGVVQQREMHDQKKMILINKESGKLTSIK